jgi:hypothetical protein
MWRVLSYAIAAVLAAGLSSVIAANISSVLALDHVWTTALRMVLVGGAVGLTFFVMARRDKFWE